MLIDELIEKLTEIKRLQGNTRCFVNGEFGIDDQKILEDRHIGYAEAHLLLSDELIEQFQIEPDASVVTFGGY